jgi:hypothetical protein
MDASKAKKEASKKVAKKSLGGQRHYNGSHIVIFDEIS